MLEIEEKSKVEKEPEKKIEKKVEGKKAKKSFLRKVKESFIAEEATDLTEKLLKEIIVPSVKNAIEDTVQDGISLLLFGDKSSARRRRRDSGSSGSRVNYRASYDYSSRYRDRDRDRDDDRRYSSSYSFDELIFETEAEALDARDSLDNILDTYEMVSVADMYDIVGESKNPEDNNYGWTNLAGVRIERTRDGAYLLHMPKARCIK